MDEKMIDAMEKMNVRFDTLIAEKERGQKDIVWWLFAVGFFDICFIFIHSYAKLAAFIGIFISAYMLESAKRRTNIATGEIKGILFIVRTTNDAFEENMKI